MDGPRDYHTVWSERKTNIIGYHLYVKSKKKKMIQMNLFRKQKQTHRLRERTYSYQGKGVGGRDRLGVWDWHAHTAIYKNDNQQGPTV